MLLSLLTLPLLVSATLEERQLFGGKAKVATVTQATPQHFKQPGVQRTKVRVGPYTLKAAQTSGSSALGDTTLLGDTFFGAINNGFCNDNGPCSVLSSKVELEFEDGKPATPATGVYMHHIITTNQQKRVSPFLSGCNRGQTTPFSLPGSGFLGSSEDKRDAIYYFANPNNTVVDSGYKLMKGEKFMSNVMLVNYNKEPKNIYVVYDNEWVTGETLPDTKGILLSISSCGKPIALSKEGPSHSKTGEWTFLEDGKVISARGHLHDGGIHVDVIINGKSVCVSQAKYGGDVSTTELNGKKWETISDMTPCYGPYQIKAGDKLAFDVLYDLKARPLRQTHGGHDTDVMGMLVVDFVGSGKSSTVNKGKQASTSKTSRSKQASISKNKAAYLSSD